MPLRGLSDADVRRLLTDPSVESRSLTAASVATEFGSGGLTAAERGIAESIFRLMMRDAEVQVREALSKHLQECPALPHDIALTLARDVDAVALPMLRSSDVLTDEDLIAIVRSSGAAKQVAIAARPAVSAPLSEVLVETRDATVVTTLVGNSGADIPEPVLARVVDQFADKDELQMRVAARAMLPITIAERLMAKASDSLRQQLMARNSAPEGVAAEVLLQARERAVIGLLGDNVAEQDVEALVRHLHVNHRLTPSIIVRALCMGDLAFFEAAMARLAAIPVHNARTLIHDAGQLGLTALFDKAGLPTPYLSAARAAIAVCREIQLDGEPHDRERRSRKIIERILTQYGDLGVDLDATDLEYLLARMGQLATSVEQEPVKH